MSDAHLIVEFPEHTAADRIASIVTGIAAYGDVRGGTNALEFRVTVFRLSKLPGLKQRLTEWENYGFVRWRVVDDSLDRAAQESST